MFKLLKKLTTKKELKQANDQKLGRGEEIHLPDKMERSREEKKENFEGKLKDRGKLFVGGLNFETTSHGLEEYFSMFGKVVDTVVVRFPDTGRSRGYGFVTFADSSVADRMESRVHILDGHRIDIRRYSSNPPPKKKDARVFLGGVPSGITKDNLRGFFTRYGEVEDVEIPLDRNTNKQKGYAFVSFKDKNAADHCLLDRFVFFKGKRVHIERAVPRCPSGVRSSTPDSRADEKETEEPATDYDALDLYQGDDVESVDSHSSASGDRSSSLEIIPGFEEFIQDYYMREMSLFNKKKVEDRNWEPRDSDLLEMEKLLTKLLINSGEEETQNLIDFSSDTNSTDEDTTDSEDDQEFVDDDDDDDDYGDGIQKSSTSLLRNPTPSSPANLYESVGRSRETVPEKPTKASKDSDFVPFQRLSVPFKVNEANGSCNLCPWKSPDGSVESLLNHYKTAAHQMKLKERFLPEQTKPIDNGPRIQDARLFSSEKTFNVTEEGQRKKQCDVQTGKTKKKKEPDQKPQVGQQQKIKRMRQRKQKATQRETQNQENAGSSLTGCNDKNISNLKLHALAKGMLCIQPLSGNKLSCKMCSKIIPEAPDFGSLMKNVSNHLQSKKHLNKLSETENSLKSALSQGDSGKNSNPKKGEKAVQNPGQKIPKNGQPGVAKTVKPADSGKGKTNKKKPDNGAAVDCQTKFLCLICNFFVNDSGKFTAHLNSKSHEETYKSKGVKMGDYATCKCCKRLLYGSLYDINKHHSKCLGKKNDA